MLVKITRIYIKSVSKDPDYGVVIGASIVSAATATEVGASCPAAAIQISTTSAVLMRLSVRAAVRTDGPQRVLADDLSTCEHS